MKNWWHYHKWYVLCGILLLLILVDLIGNTFGWFKKTPDIQIAYIGETTLPDDTIKAIKEAFSFLAEDYNRDGEIIVQINQFISSTQNADPETAYYQQASEISLIGDINDCESYFFLLENPDDFQKKFQILAMPDGSCPSAFDISTENKVVQWESCSVLSKMDLGRYTATLSGQTVSGSNQEILSKLYLGRRCFYNEKHSSNAEQCSQLWDILKGGVN